MPPITDIWRMPLAARASQDAMRRWFQSFLPSSIATSHGLTPLEFCIVRPCRHWPFEMSARLSRASLRDAMKDFDTTLDDECHGHFQQKAVADFRLLDIGFSFSRLRTYFTTLPVSRLVNFVLRR